jgi:hypothetical protein
MIHQVKERIVKAAQRRAAERGRPFDITVEDLVWPYSCPVLGIRLDYRFSNRRKPTHPSLDQLEAGKGYTKQNTRVISKRANEVKGNATALELLLVAQYMAAELGLQLYVADDTVQAPPSLNNAIGVHMSDQKQAALSAAVAVSKDGDTALATAKKFYAFLTGTDAPAANKPTASPVGKPAAGKPAAAKPAAGKVATPESKAAARLAAKQAAEAAAEDAADEGTEEAEEGAEGPTKEEVGAKIKELMNAGLRPAAKELLAEFGAEALSGLSEDDYAAFLEKADELLIAG